MILTLNDKREISQIIASFTDEDYERINSEVDRLCKRCDPINAPANTGLKPSDWIMPFTFLTKMKVCIRNQLCRTNQRKISAKMNGNASRK
ncbi:hypothetical protein KTU0001_06880 [Escherichia coli]|nr:hypothetical protein KTU0001_06880 [Escherichia coli]